MPIKAAETGDLDGEPVEKAKSYSPSFPGRGMTPDHVVDDVSRQNGSSITNLPVGSPRPGLDVTSDGRVKVVPFEFRALEVCLESACRCLESEVCILLNGLTFDFTMLP